MENKEFQTLKITAEDGYKLSARIYGSLEKEKPLLVIAAATGVPQRYYKKFGLYMAKQNYTVITFDYRGIAESRQGKLKGFKTSFLEWARLDLKCIIDWACTIRPPLIIGHSFGGQAFGLLPEANNCLGLVTFGTGTGWLGYMPKGEVPKVWLLWNVLGPVLNRFYGYFPSRLIGLGEDLPLGVFEQWKKWCNYPSHWFDDPKENFQEFFSAVKVPVMSVNSIDDQWAPPKSGEAFMKHFNQSQVEYANISPAEHQLKEIRHMGYFHSKTLPLTSSLIENFLSKEKEESKRQ